MNQIRWRLLLSWSLMAGCVVLYVLHHPFLAWCILLWVHPLVRLGLPRPVSSPTLQVAFLCGIIGFLAAVIVNQYYAFPPALLTFGQVIGALVSIPLVVWLGYFDYKTFKTTPTNPVQARAEADLRGEQAQY